MCRLPSALAIVCFTAAAAPPLASLWKSSLPAHVLVQFPLLLAAGVLVGTQMESSWVSRSDVPRLEGLTAVILGAFCLCFWMLPRWLDAAVGDWRVDAAKVLSLTNLVGVPVGWGWRRITPLWRGFLAANAISMLLALGIVYLSAPVRLCNTYLLDEQAVLGRGILVLSVYAASIAAWRLMTGDRRSGSAPENNRPGSDEMRSS